MEMGTPPPRKTWEIHRRWGGSLAAMPLRRASVGERGLQPCKHPGVSFSMGLRKRAGPSTACQLLRHFAEGSPSEDPGWSNSWVVESVSKGASWEVWLQQEWRG